MHGPWKQDKSKMYQALVSVGFTSGDKGKGGSFGYGKAGMIRGSAIRTVIAYTCFREREDDPGVTRRLLGVTYWDTHTFENENYTRFARLGKEHGNDVVIPFENKAADEIAERLGLQVRSPDDDSQLGTTIILIDPTVEPEELVTAIERSWWPALEDRRSQFSAYVRTTAGKTLYPRPRRDTVLRTFIEAYEIATEPKTNPGGDKKSTLRGLGELGLVNDVEGWSYADQTGENTEQKVQHCSLVALMRDPRMVVEYSEVGRKTPPYVRGAFVADPKINELLRATEPKGHDAWDWKTEDASPEAKRWPSG